MSNPQKLLTMRDKFNPQKILEGLFADDWLSPWQLR